MMDVQVAPALLDIEDLTVLYEHDGAVVRAVDGACLSVGPGEGVGIVGESGSGKSTLARALLALLPSSNARVVSGRLQLDGSEYSLTDTAAMRRLRGRQVAMVFQDPLSYLNPLMTAGTQIAEAVRFNDPGIPVRSRVRELLELVRLPARTLDAYPHELSGGMRQRVLLAVALGCRPRVLVADEPTTALDVTTQAEILALLKDVRQQLGMALILISHDLGVVASLCDRIYVMYAGRTIEWGPRARILSNPRHFYTRGLLHAARSVRDEQGRFITLKGDALRTAQIVKGCPFQGRCDHARPICAEEMPPMEYLDAESGHAVRCWYHEE